MDKTVSSVKCESYDSEEVLSSVRRALVEIDFDLPEGKTVLIKPNIMSQNRPEQHCIINYSVVEALCRLLKERNCRIQIGESISFYQTGLTRKAFETSRIKEVADRYGAELIAFEEEKLAKVPSNSGVLDGMYMPECLLKADLVINACKLKTHSGMRLSGAVKNMFGCLPGGYKQRIHMWSKNDFELSDVFLDIHEVVKPSLSIMDAVVSLDGGPSAIGKPVKTSRILASRNAVALDLVACRIVGYDPEDIAFLIRAKERAMISDFTDVELRGDVVPMKFKALVKGEIAQKREKQGIFVKYTYVTPFVDGPRCTGCGRCVDECPTKAITIDDKKASIHTESCINCYRCLTVCPEKAIGVRSSFINKFIQVVRRIIGI